MNSFKAKHRPLHSRGSVVRIELEGAISDKVQIAQLFRDAYDRLDSLSCPEVSRVEVVYGESFQVDKSLVEEFSHAAREALAYQNALTFGRPIESVVIGLGQIADPETRALLQQIYEEGVPRRSR